MGDCIMSETKKVTVTLFEDNRCSMAMVKINDYCAFEGNEWDFHPGCFGPIKLNSKYMPKEIKIKHTLDEFDGSSDFFDQVVGAYQDAGFEVDTQYSTYKFET
jgi:hypothetical protein